MASPSCDRRELVGFEDALKELLCRVPKVPDFLPLD